MQQNVFQQLSGVDQLITVKGGLDGAKSYSMGPNGRVPLFDADKDVFYLKTTDQNGFPKIRAFKFEEVFMVDSDNSGDGISLDTIRSIIREELSSVKEELLNAKQPVSESEHFRDQKSNAGYNVKSDTTANAASGQKQRQPRQNTANVVNSKE